MEELAAKLKKEKEKAEKNQKAAEKENNYKDYRLKVAKEKLDKASKSANEAKKKELLADGDLEAAKIRCNPVLPA